MKKLLIILTLCGIAQTAMADVVDDIRRSNAILDDYNKRQVEITRNIPPSTTDPRFVPRDTVGTFYIGPNGSYSPNNIFVPPPTPTGYQTYYGY